MKLIDEIIKEYREKNCWWKYPWGLETVLEKHLQGATDTKEVRWVGIDGKAHKVEWIIWKVKPSEIEKACDEIRRVDEEQRAKQTDEIWDWIEKAHHQYWINYIYWNIDEFRKAIEDNLPRTDEKEVEIEKKSLLETEWIYHVTECNICKNEVQARDHYCPWCGRKIKRLGTEE